MKRREFLKVLGGTSALSLCPGLGSLALADTSAPKRLLVLSHCHGWTYDTWKIRPEGSDLSTPWSLALTHLDDANWSETLLPLAPHRNRMVAIDGLSLATAELDMDGNRHDTGWVHAWTGNRADFSATDTKAVSASIDQIVAKAIARPERLPSLELSLDDARENGRPIAYSSAGLRLPVENDPMRVWQRLFGPSQAPDPLSARREKVLGFAYEEYRQIAPRLSAPPATKAENSF